MEEQRNPVADEEAGAAAPETDVAPEPSPAADDDGGGGGGDDGDAAPDTDRVVCPDATVQLDGLLTAASGGGPTPLFRVAQLACWAFAASVCCGTFVTPSLAEAHALADPLLFGGMLALALAVLAFVPILGETRRVCRSTGEGAILLELGAGTARLSEKRFASLSPYLGLLDVTSRWQWIWRFLTVALFAPFIATGYGEQEAAWHNAASLLAALVFTLLPATAARTWIATLHIATALLGDQIDDITSEINKELQSKDVDMTPAEWEVAVVAPVRELIDDLRLLTLGWAKGLVALTVLGLTGAGASVCLALSPSLGPWVAARADWLSASAAEHALRFGFWALAIFFMIFPLVTLYAPAALSTACDDFKEKLNAVRISDLSQEIDARKEEQL